FGGGQDIGIDLVCQTVNKEYWAVQCKCYREDTPISKEDVDSFLSASGKRFRSERGDFVSFSHRLWISTTNDWSKNAEASLQNQDPEVQRLNLNDLASARVNWDNLDKGLSGAAARFEKFSLRSYQKDAIEAVHRHFLDHDRGKVIMACGTGKTFLSLKIAEHETGNRGLILVLVPSIALVGQTLRTWCEQCCVPLHPLCVCSDSSVSKNTRGSSADSSDVRVIDLALPASTDSDRIAHQLRDALHSSEGMTVVFSTYQSIDVISTVQKSVGFVFDLIICDEAHRTTGVTLADAHESSFVKVHNNDFLRSKKRLYMTATPRIYRDVDKQKAELHDVTLCSMDDESLYGAEMYHLSFGDAVSQDLLSDYKVLVLTVNDSSLTPSVRQLVRSRPSSLTADDAIKLVGCYNALSKHIVGDDGVLLAADPSPMKRAVAFCQNIAISKELSKEFNELQDKYFSDLSDDHRSPLSCVAARHIDGTMQSTERDGLLNWLKNPADTAVGTCRVLTNVRCLSEGVDVPSLDAVLFLSPRNSKIDIVQSVGRVMRKADGKKYGYIVIPLVMPSTIDPTKELDKNPGNYKVVWDVLNALRSHDDRLAFEIERLRLENKDSSDRVLIGHLASDFPPNAPAVQATLLSPAIFSDLQGSIYARMVEKVGERQYWEHWAGKVAAIAQTQEDRIRALVKNIDVLDAFSEFVAGLQAIINPSITEAQAIEMLSQHLITKPVFEALFENYSFSAHNPVSKSMQKMLQILEENAFEKETQELAKFYESVQKTVRGVLTPEGRQAIIVKLYDNFFRIAFPRMVEQLGIVYTPPEIVDFILQSVNDVLQKEFGRSLSAPNVHILDPFTGTGTFIARLLESDLIRPEDLERKYSSEIYANEIVLLAYYIAAINIENAYHARRPTSSYTPFPGICLTDTFQMTEWDKREHIAQEFFLQNSAKVDEQKAQPITVIVGNPPYSVGQKSANDNAQNQEYPKLEEKIREKYASASAAANKNSLYDSYIKAFRWATDRLDKNGGIIGFITNGGWLDGNAMDGFRKHLAKDFSSIYVFNLRGNQRTSGELLKKEGERIFNGVRVSPAITLLVRNPNHPQKPATIHYHDIGDYLSQKQKLKKIKAFGSVCNSKMQWERIQPNEAGDWINQRNPLFATYYPLGDKKGEEAEKAVFLPNYSGGLKTNRDAWCYNSSKSDLEENIKRSIDFYNSQVDEFKQAKISRPSLKAEDFVTYDSTKFSWDRQQKRDIAQLKKYSYDAASERIAVYRPFFKQNAYFNRQLNNTVSYLPSLFPTAAAENRVICVPGVGETREFSALITDVIPD
ncbi:MAG TPA: DEAD/DEAH box helicase family protein, partial [Methanocorpusculum sp.]|nr:DEAD/DEAH box helicase family protein [Methanocorpusculum sp.]